MNREIILTIEKYDDKGNGIGKWTDLQERVWKVIVPCAAVGDCVKVELFKKRRSAYQARLISVEIPSSFRVQPRCVHFGDCGGCRWQQVDYAEQLRTKELYVRDCLEKFQVAVINFHPILPSQSIWGYRNKMEFSFSEASDGQQQFLGLYRIGASHRVFNLTECHLVSPWYAEAAKAVREWWADSGLRSFHPSSARGSLRTLTLREGRHSGDRLAMLTVSGNPEYALHKSQLDALVEKLKAAVEPNDPHQKLSIFLRIQQAIKGQETNFFEMQLYGPDTIRETLCIVMEPGQPAIPYTFQVSPSAFFQPNPEQAEKFFSRAFALSNVPKDGVIYDLYCGTGTIGICASKYVNRVIGIELSPEGALDARTNAANNGLDNVTIFSGDVGKILPKLLSEGYPAPDLVVVDPPRTGLSPDVIQTLIALNPPKILYISCNPLKQAEDLAQLAAHGYRVIEYQPVDQFAHTPHIEAIAVLQH